MKPERWVAVGSPDRLANQAIVCVRIEGADLILVRDGETIHAFERACPHEQADLGLGCVAEGLGDGAVSPGWPSRDLRRYAVRVADGQVWIDAGALGPAAG
jgi:3-phenylpropionate/trans-cinnamate dioxygenase ferredoxin subunit